MRVRRSAQDRLFEVSATARGLTLRAGTGAARVLADRIGLSEGLSVACGQREWRRHDPGAVLRDLIVTLADGGVCFADIEALGTGAAPGEPVASDSTAWRLVDALAGDKLAGVRLADAERAARAYVWANGGCPPSVQALRDGDGGSEGRATPKRVFGDVDATLVDVHSEQQHAAPTCKRGYGTHPIGFWLDRGDGTDRGAGRAVAPRQRGREQRR